MSKAYVDTTVLTDILLKRRWPAGMDADAALKRYSETQLPHYAIKEFKKGPLAVFVWVHNKLVTTRSVADTVAAIQKVSPTPQRYRVSTALEALREAMRAAGAETPKALLERYGETARSDRVNCDEYRLALKALIYRAWARHRRVASAIVQPLPCYTAAKPFEDRGLLSLEPTKCRPAHECCLGGPMRADPAALKALKTTVDKQPPKAEIARRAEALASLLANKTMTEKMCDDLGDAVLAFFAPSDSVILTTNTRDFEPLAGALGKKVERP
jgi:hypothetical protein